MSKSRNIVSCAQFLHESTGRNLFLQQPRSVNIKTRSIIEYNRGLKIKKK